MTDEIYQAIASRICEEPRLYGASKAERQVAFRARRTGLTVLQRVAISREYDENLLEFCFKFHGMELARTTLGQQLVVDGYGADARKLIIVALRLYNRRCNKRAWNATRHTDKRDSAGVSARLQALGINIREHLQIERAAKSSLAPRA